MRPVMQRGADDCMAACIASLLCIPLPLVPAYAPGDGEAQVMSATRWLKRLGYTLINLSVRNETIPFSPIAGSVLAVATVDVPRCPRDHAIIVRLRRVKSGTRHDMIHDPAGGKRSDYGRLKALGFLVPVDPTYREATP